MTYVLFDIGGTTTRFAQSDDLVTLSHIQHTPTTVQPKAYIKKFTDYVSNIKDVTAVVGGVRGILDEERRSLYRDSILKQWLQFPLAEEMEAVAGADVTIENDAALSGLGEAHFGAGQGAEIVVYHDISTGVGGAKITKGEIEFITIGVEPGHQVLDIDRTILGEDVPPTLENLISGRAVEGRMGMKPQEIPADDVVWDELAGYLAQGLRNSILYWSPEVIVLGGSMMTGVPGIPLEVVRKETVKVLDDIVACPFITLASLGSDAGLYGAMALAKKRAGE